MLYSEMLKTFNMVFSLSFVFLTCFLYPSVIHYSNANKISPINIESDGGYIGVTIAIGKDVPENKQIISNLKVKILYYFSCFINANLLIT